MKSIKPLFAAKKNIVIFFLLLFALFLRVYHLHQYDFWFDELGIYLFSAESLKTIAEWCGTSVPALIVDQLKNEPHSPFYFIFIFLYSFLFGSELALRILSVILSMLSLWVFYKLSRLFLSRRASFYALLIMSLNPFHIWYAQEARGYAMAGFFCLLMVYLYIKALRTDRRMYWLSFSGVSVLAIYSNYHAGFLFLASAVGLLFKENRRHIKKWLLVSGLVFLSLLLLIPIILHQLSFVKNSFWLLPPSKAMLPYTFMVFTLGYSANMFQYKIALSVFMLLFSYGAFAVWRKDKEKAILLLSFLFFPILITYLVSRYIMPIYISRYLFIFSPFYYLLVAKGIESIKNKLVQILVCFCVVGVLAAGLINYYRGVMFEHWNQSHIQDAVVPKKIYRYLLMTLDQEFKTGDLIVVSDPQSYFILLSHMIRYRDQIDYAPSKTLHFFFYPTDLDSYTAHLLKADTSLSKLPAYKKNIMHHFTLVGAGETNIKKELLTEDSYRRIWLITTTWTPAQVFGTNTCKVKHAISEKFKKVSEKEHDGVSIELYTR